MSSVIIKEKREIMEIKNNKIHINLCNDYYRDKIVKISIQLFKDYNLPMDILVKNLKGNISNQEDLFYALCRVHKYLKENGYKTALNNSTYSDEDFITKVSAKLSEVVIGDVWDDLKLIPEDYQIHHNLGDYFFEKTVFDIKSKRRKRIPSLNYDVTVPYSQRNQKAHFYICCHADWKFNEIVIMGYISKSDFWNIARCVEHGEVASNDTHYVDGTHIVPYKKLNNFTSNFKEEIYQL